MPVSLLKKAFLKKKQYSLIILFLLSPLFFCAQSLTGLWVGALNNDSTTIRKDQSFEIALTEYKGKVYGYSRSEFIVNDTLFYIVKRVKGTIDGDICEVTDDEIIAYNFRGKLDKGIKVTSTFRRSKTDSTWSLDGTWKTNATKKYYAVTGKVGLSEEKDLTASKIFPHLEELNLANDIAFYKERTETPVVVKIAKPERNRFSFNKIDPTTDVAMAPVRPDMQRAEAEYSKTVDAVDKRNSAFTNKQITSEPVDIKAAQPDLQRAETEYIKTVAASDKTNNKTTAGITDGGSPAIPAIKQSQPQIAKAVTKPAAEEEPWIDEDVVKRTNTPVQQKIIENKTTGSKASVAIIKPPVAQPEQNNTIKKTEPVNAKEKSAVAINNTNPEQPPVSKPQADVTLNAAAIAGRKSEFSQGVNFKSDSLVIALYDNGEIDGDTVSVYINGELFMAKQGLKASAIKKTIHITPGNEDFSLVLFADNLGKYPPNTGLLVVYDGDDTYNLRFSSDFQKNAGIVFRRKK